MFINTFLIDDSMYPVKADLHEYNDKYTIKYFVMDQLKETEDINKETNLFFLESYIQNKLKKIVILKE